MKGLFRFCWVVILSVWICESLAEKTVGASHHALVVAESSSTTPITTSTSFLTSHTSLTISTSFLTTHTFLTTSTTDSPTMTTSSTLSQTATPSPTPSPVEEETRYSWALLIFISLLFSILWTSYFLQRNKIHVVHETVISIILGLVVGLIIRLSPDTGIRDIMSFDHHYFFNLLLPPIILNSGYDMKRKHFFRNFGSILTFALLGTMLSTVIIGQVVDGEGLMIRVSLYLLMLTGVYDLHMGFLDCTVFGAILSSTDPVTILAMFHQLQVDPKLYAIIFGESVLNDSVAIVLFSTLGQFRDQELSIANVIKGIGSFMGVFFGSTMLGVIMALICALMLKHSHLDQYPSLESCLVSLMAFSSYLLSNGVHMSGIVSLLFCGMILRHYAYDNMSIRSRRTTKYMFRVLSQMSENFIFIYLGINLFTFDEAQYYPILIIVTLILILVARYASVIPLAQCINWMNVTLYHREPVIPRNHQLMLWWAGLRGAIAFALSFDVSGSAAKPIQSTVLVVCVVSIILLGGTTHQALQRLNIKTGVASSSEEYVRPGRLSHSRQNSSSEHTDSSAGEEDWEDEETAMRPSYTSQSVDNRNRRYSDESDSSFMRPGVDMTHWFVSFDNKWIKPLFTRKMKLWNRSIITPPNEPNDHPGTERLLNKARSSPPRQDEDDQASSSHRIISKRAFGRKESDAAVSPPQRHRPHTGNPLSSAPALPLGSHSQDTPSSRSLLRHLESNEEGFQDAHGKQWKR